MAPPSAAFVPSRTLAFAKVVHADPSREAVAHTGAREHPRCVGAALGGRPPVASLRVEAGTSPAMAPMRTGYVSYAKVQARHKTWTRTRKSARSWPPASPPLNSSDTSLPPGDCVHRPLTCRTNYSSVCGGEMAHNKPRQTKHNNAARPVL
ncbi:hypothetical protein Vafri_2351 [Volvox africanus]|nr:hypothetical protein Vafri_2351 [Volvox africanus]